MRRLLSDIRSCYPALGFIFFIGCTSTGPLSTEIDRHKTPVVSAPRDFQSPFEAIDKFSAILSNSKHSFQKDILFNTPQAYKILVQQQKAAEDELESSKQLLLKPGYSYEFDLESFCVNAGVERPVSGDGLFIGKVKGAPKQWLPQILENYKRHNISQNDAQILIWSLLSGSRFNELSSENKKNLVKIFPDAVTRFGNSSVENFAKTTLLSQVPSEILSAKDKFNEFQSLLQNSQNQFSEIEKILSPKSSREAPLPVGWLKHEDGYYIHLKSDSYRKVHVQIYSPEAIKAGTYFKPSKHVALPGQGQRLALSGNVIKKTYAYSVTQFKNLTHISPQEAAFIMKHPIDAYSIHESSQKALRATWDNLKSSNNFQDDSTDAFRHFYWSGLVTREIGPEKAREYLDAHEDFPDNNPKAKKMDLFNNEKGIQYGSQYEGSNFEQDLTQEGLNKIRDRDLRWIK